jgi:hypothetical protein
MPFMIINHVPISVSILLTCVCVITFGQLQAQIGEYTNCETYYYKKTKKKSGEKCFDKDNRYGIARVYNDSGRVVYEVHLRRFAGHASVQFSFHDNGAIHKVNYSSAPDAGIQWYRSYHEFSPTGKLINSWEDSHDHRVTRIDINPPPIKHETIPPISPKPTPETSLPMPTQTPGTQKEVVVCQRMLSNEIWVLNPGNQHIVFKAISKHKSDKNIETTLRPGETKMIGSYSMGEQFYPPVNLYTFEVATNGKRKPNTTYFKEASHTTKDDVHKHFIVVSY